MKVTERNGIGPVDLEVAAAPEAASQVAQRAASVAPADAFEGRRARRGADDEPSSVRPRHRSGEGMPAHRLLAGVLSPGASIGGGFAEVFDHEGRTAEDRLREALRSERLIDFYEDSMADLHRELDALDHVRGEDLWYERYRGDAQRHMDGAELRERSDAARVDLEHRGTREGLDDAARRHADALGRASADAARVAERIAVAARQAGDLYSR